MYEQILSLVHGLNNNKVFSGVAMIVMNFGSRYVTADITSAQEELLKSRAFKTVALFCMFFVGTRDILTAIILTAVLLAMLHSILNETKMYKASPETPTLEEEYGKALKVVQMYEKDKRGLITPLQSERDKVKVAERESFTDSMFGDITEKMYSY